MKRGLLLGLGLSLGTLSVALSSGCHRPIAAGDPAKIAALRHIYDQLHVRFENAAAREPILARAEADPGQIIVAVRSGLLEELAGSVAQRYLDHVTLDLARVKAHSSGEVKKKTFLGSLTIGEWKVAVEINSLMGDLRSGAPKMTLLPPNRVGIRIPIEVRETTGTATLQFSWDSKALANALCRDFTITRVIEGRVLPQVHEVQGAFELRNQGGHLTATPVFPDKKVDLRLDLTAPSWAALERDLEAQNTAGKCGAFIKREQALSFLRGLAARGIGVRIPRSVFRTVTLPAQLSESVLVRERQVALSVSAESLRVEKDMLWSSAAVSVRKDPAVAPSPQP